MQMGLPIERLIVASNQNDILTRFFEDGAMQREMINPSLSPSMDIQVSSNFERLLFELLGRDGAKTARLMADFSITGNFSLSEAVMAKARSLFSAYRLDDAGTIAEIASTSRDNGMMLDPHSAIGVSAARRAIADGMVPDCTPVVALACAHPAKFQDTVARATGTKPALPAHLADLMQRQERKHLIEANAAAVKSLVLEKRRSQ